jgi:hypothetical protein
MALYYARSTSPSAQTLLHARELSDHGALSVILHRLGPETMSKRLIGPPMIGQSTVTVAAQCCFRVALLGAVHASDFEEQKRNRDRHIDGWIELRCDTVIYSIHMFKLVFLRDVVIDVSNDT